MGKGESPIPVAPENIESTLQELEKMWASKLCIGKEAESRARDSLMHYKTILGEDFFPWDTWAEFREAMDETVDNMSFDKYMSGIFEPGKCGIGCSIPIPVNTFHFQEQPTENGNLDFRWSSAMAIGWIEEDLKWFYDRLFGGDFEGARLWYPFPAYHAANARAEVLKADTTEKGARFRRVWEGKPDPNVQAIEPTFEQRLELALPQREGVAESESDLKENIGIGGLLLPIKLKEVFNAVSDVVPGFGSFFEKRMHIMLNQSLIGDIDD
jgi:hypothetical protein